MKDYYDMLSYSAVEIYKMVLDGTLDKFPKHFWSKPNDTQNIAQCVKYLIEDQLKWDKDSIKEKLSSKIFKENKLHTPLTLLGGSPYALINLVYPNEYKPWEFKIIPIVHNNKEMAREAIKWLVEERLKLKVPNDFKSLKQRDFMEHNVFFVLRQYLNLYEAIKDVYPSVERFDLFKLSSGESNQENALNAFKWFIEEHLSITATTDLYKLTVKDFSHEKVKPALRYFKNNFRKAIMLLYGEEVKPWLFVTGAPNNYYTDKNNRIKAVIWLTEDVLKLSRHSMYLISFNDFKKNKLERMFHDYYSNNLSALFLDLFEKDRDTLIKESPTLQSTKVITAGEVKQGTFFNLKQDVFCYLPKCDINVISNNKSFILKAKSYRLTGASELYSHLSIKVGDTISFFYEKESKIMYINKL